MKLHIDFSFILFLQDVGKIKLTLIIDFMGCPFIAVFFKTRCVTVLSTGSREEYRALN